MKTVILSDKYQVVIPKEIRKDLRLKPGQRLAISRDKHGIISVAPVPSVEEISQRLSGLPTVKAWTADVAEQRQDWDKR